MPNAREIPIEEFLNNVINNRPPVMPQWVLAGNPPREQIFKGEKAHPNGPELWDKLLYAVKEIYEPHYACVAGGAVRDRRWGFEPKDVDIFVHLKETPPYEELLELAQCLGWNGVMFVGNPGHYGENKNVKIVLGGVVFGHSVELIFSDKPDGTSIINDFDFFANQCWYDGEEHSTKKADYDIAKKQLTPIDGKWTDEKNRKFDRINKRLGDKLRRGEDEPWYAKFNKTKGHIG